MDLSHLKPSAGAMRKRKRVGRGPGSGLGKTSGRGNKGAGARSGGSVPPGYEGGQMPLSRRLPKRGFHNRFREEYTVINIGSLERFPAGSVVDAAALRQNGLLRGRNRKVKILANGELNKALTVRADAFSARAREIITTLGGTAQVG